MKINLKTLVIISYSLLNCCFGSKYGLPKVYFHTPVKKKTIQYDVKPSCAAQKYPTYLLNFDPSILIICPNSYEFEAVHNALLKSKYKLHCSQTLTNKIFGTLIYFDPNLIALQKKKIAPLYFFNINNVKICLALCGQRTAEVDNFSSKLQNTFENLNTVILYGICGYSNPDISIGSIILPSKYVRAERPTIGDPDKDPNFFLKSENFYFKSKSEIPIEDKKQLATKINTLQKIFNDKELHPQCSLNFSSDAFVKDTNFIDQMIKELNTHDICLNTEDYAIAQIFNNVDFIPIRSVSDHAGVIDDKISDGRRTACKYLTRAALLTFELIGKKKL